MAEIPLEPPVWTYNDDNPRAPFLRARFVQQVTSPDNPLASVERSELLIFTVEVPLPKAATKTVETRDSGESEP